jgi:hypothetical protein
MHARISQTHTYKAMTFRHTGISQADSYGEFTATSEVQLTCQLILKLCIRTSFLLLCDSLMSTAFPTHCYPEMLVVLGPALRAGPGNRTWRIPWKSDSWNSDGILGVSLNSQCRRFRILSEVKCRNPVCRKGSPGPHRLDSDNRLNLPPILSGLNFELPFQPQPL